MKKYLLFFSILFICLKSQGQSCDSTITIVKTVKYPGDPVQTIGIEVDSIRNGLLASRSLNGTIIEENLYDSLERLTSSLQRLTNSSYFTDSITIAYDTSSRIVMKDYFEWQTGTWQYNSDTARVQYFYSALHLDSILKYKWDGTNFNPFYRYSQTYGVNDTLNSWQVDLIDSGQWIVDTIAIVGYSLHQWGFTRSDTVFTDSINFGGFYSVFVYDSLERITHIENSYFEFESFRYKCGQLSDWWSSCNGCHSGNYVNFEFDSLCRITQKHFGHYSISGEDAAYTNTYYYAGCSTLVTVAPAPVKICKGDSVDITAFSFGGTPPWQVQWSPMQGLSNDTVTSIKASPDSSTNYVITVTDSAGLVARDTILITVVNPPLAHISIASMDTISNCQSAVLMADSLQGYNIYWQRDSLFFGYYSTKNIVYNGTYILSIMLGSPNYNLCPTANDTLDFNYFTHPAPFVSLSRGCGEVYVSRSDPNSTIEWFVNNQAIPDSSRDTLVVNTTGSYGVIITDSSGCSSPSIVFLNYYTNEATIVPTSSCLDSCNGRMSVQAGYSNYVWSNGGTTNEIRNLCSGIYSVEVTDNFGCTVSLSDTLNNFPKADIYYLNSGTSSSGICDGFVIPVASTNMTYPGTYTWEDNSHGYSMDSLCSGWHTVLMTPYFSQCPQLDSIFVAPNFSNDTCSILFSKTDPTCVGKLDGSISISSSTGSPFACQWYSSNTYNNIATLKQNLQAGVYSCLIIDQNGCVDSADIALVDPTPLTVSLSSNQNACQDSCLLTATASGGSAPYTYTWCNGQTGTQILYCGQECRLIIKDTNNCLLVDTLRQNQVFPLQLSITKIPTTCSTCNDGIMYLSASGGTAPYLFSIDGGPPTPSDTITGLSGGLHTACLIGADSCSTCTSSQILLNTNSIPQASTIQIYPNPFHEKLNVHYEEYKTGIETKFLLTDLFGRVVVNLPVNKTDFEINGKGLNPGMYIYELKTDGFIRETGRLIHE